LGFRLAGLLGFGFFEASSKMIEAFGAPIDDAAAGAIADYLLKKYGSAGPS